MKNKINVHIPWLIIFLILLATTIFSCYRIFLGEYQLIFGVIIGGLMTILAGMIAVSKVDNND